MVVIGLVGGVLWFANPDKNVEELSKVDVGIDDRAP